MQHKKSSISFSLVDADETDCTQVLLQDQVQLKKICCYHLSDWRKQINFTHCILKMPFTSLCPSIGAFRQDGEAIADDDSTV